MHVTYDVDGEDKLANNTRITLTPTPCCPCFLTLTPLPAHKFACTEIPWYRD
jgi:hypothetical protein